MIKETSKLVHHYIPVEDIPEEGLSVAYDDMPDLLDVTGELTAEGPIHGSAFIRKVDSEVYLTGDIEARLALPCDRCLAVYGEPVAASFSYVLVQEPEESGAEKAIREPDVEVTPFDGSRIPIADIFREQLLLNVPFRRLCREECRGLCPGCGANLNSETCACAREREEPPFSVLGALK